MSGGSQRKAGSPLARKERAPTDEWFKAADALWDRHRPKEAFRLFLKAAKAGDGGSQLNVGFCYDVGRGVRKSRSRAMYWYRRALRRGETVAAVNIGIIYRDEGRPRLAVRWLEKAVRFGHDDAMLDLAKLYLGPLDDLTKAKWLLTKVASSKNVCVDAEEQAQKLLRRLK